MQSSLLPLSLAALAPVFAFIGFGAVPAMGLMTAMGTLAMLMHDYNAELAYQRELSPRRVREPLPLAA